MQVISGPVGRERVHYQAPAAATLDAQMRIFLDWFEGGPPTDPVLKAALAHLWFVTIHPFEDGNGRIARAVGDMALGELRGPMREETNSWLNRVSLGVPTQHATAREGHNRLMLTKAIDLSARLKRPVQLPITPDDIRSA